MSKKPRRKFSTEQKSEAVETYISGQQSAAEVAADLNISQGLLYKWKAGLEEGRRTDRLEELQADGSSLEQAKKLRQQEEEIALYQKKIAEQAVIIDLLKKLQTSTLSRPESELSGLIDTIKKSARKRIPFK